MKYRTRLVMGCAIAAALVALVAAQDALSKRVSLDLKAMAPADAFGTLASSVGLKAVVDPTVTLCASGFPSGGRRHSAIDGGSGAVPRLPTSAPPSLASRARSSIASERTQASKNPERFRPATSEKTASTSASVTCA